MNWKETRIGEVILGERSDPSLENHIRSGFRVVSVEEKGLKVQRIHMVYLKEQGEQPEEWVLRWDQLDNYNLKLLPLNAQLPLL